MNCVTGLSQHARYKGGKLSKIEVKRGQFLPPPSDHFPAATRPSKHFGRFPFRHGGTPPVILQHLFDWDFPTKTIHPASYPPCPSWTAPGNSGNWDRHGRGWRWRCWRSFFGPAMNGMFHGIFMVIHRDSSPTKIGR